MEEGAKLRIYDPQVSFEQIKMDLSLEKFEWDRPSHTLKAKCAPGSLSNALPPPCGVRPPLPLPTSHTYPCTD
jgi:hypothetical protein